MLADHGIRNVQPVGCPSLYWPLRRDFRVEGCPAGGPVRAAANFRTFYGRATHAERVFLRWCADRGLRFVEQTEQPVTEEFLNGDAPFFAYIRRYLRLRGVLFADEAEWRAALSAYAIAESGRPLLPLAVYDVDCDLVAGDVKLRLCELFGDETEAFFVRGGAAKKIRLFELDRQGEYDASCAVVVGEIPLLRRTRFTYDDLLSVLRLLRAPDGCPWDRVQTHESIRSNMIEEAYELVDAVDSKDDAKILEETGDVLMQGAFHSVLAQERGAFTPDDVTSAVCQKLIFRHSHIFGKDKAEDEAGALSVWDRNKAEEKGQKTPSDTVRDVPSAFPAVLRAQKVAKRAAKFGYDFQDAAEAAEKVKEELGELLEALAEGDKAHIAEEAGDLLFAAVNVGRLAGADCEESLQESTRKFVRRFCETDALVRADGRQMQDLPAAQLWKYYEEAKKRHG